MYEKNKQVNQAKRFSTASPKRIDMVRKDISYNVYKQIKGNAYHEERYSLMNHSCESESYETHPLYEAFNGK